MIVMKLVIVGKWALLCGRKMFISLRQENGAKCDTCENSGRAFFRRVLCLSSGSGLSGGSISVDIRGRSRLFLLPQIRLSGFLDWGSFHILLLRGRCRHWGQGVMY